MKHYKPSLRLLLLFAFSLIAILPVLTLGHWIITENEKREYSNVKEKHLLVAKNMTLALSRYADDIISTLKTASKLSMNERSKQPMYELMRSQHIERFWIYNRENHTLKLQLCKSSIPKMQKNIELTQEQQRSILEAVRRDTIQFLPSQFNNKGKVTILVLYPSKTAKYLWIAEINMNYLREIQSKIKFGKQGHAAIVDKQGNILAHPKPEWVEKHKNISKLSIVKQMMRGERGVSKFYSPAKNAEMIAGFSTVPMTGWGIMVPQPISELEANISSIKMTVISIMLIGFLFAVLLSYLLAYKLVKPIQELVINVQKIATHKGTVTTMLIPTYTIKELYELSHAFKIMTHRLEDKSKVLEFNANHDSLTSLPNRFYLKSFIQKQIKSQQPFPFVLLDLDHFKDINDHWSHLHGDELLIMIGKGLEKILHTRGMVARIGGDEFAIVLNSGISENEIYEIMQKIMDMFQSGYTIYKEVLHVGCSMGIAYYPQDAETISDLMQCADVAMYAAKKNPDTHWVIYEPSMKTALHKRVEIAQALNAAIAKEEFVLHYQPKIDILTHKITGVEALVRWDHPEFGLIYPSDFIDIAESAGLMVPLGKLIIKQVCQDIYMWTSQGVGIYNVAINLSRRQLDDIGFLTYLEECIDTYQISKKNIEFEITESVLAKNDHHTKQILTALHQNGFTISVDDFGTGESSLGRLKMYEVDSIKIDKLFIADIVTSQKSKDLLISMIQMADILGMGIVIEGVEYEEQRIVLAEIYKGVVQGFFYSRAVDNTAIIPLLKKCYIYPKA